MKEEESSDMIDFHIKLLVILEKKKKKLKLLNECECLLQSIYELKEK